MIMETRNAIITDAVVGINDVGVLDTHIVFNYGDGTQQALGSYCLYDPRPGIDAKNYAGYFIYGVLAAAGVRRWNDLEGRAVRVKCDATHIEGIGHIVKDEWFYPGEVFGQPE
jgi:hypothetical protein